MSEEWVDMNRLRLNLVKSSARFGTAEVSCLLGNSPPATFAKHNTEHVQHNELTKTEDLCHVQMLLFNVVKSRFYSVSFRFIA